MKPNAKNFDTYCQSKLGTSLEYPFGPDTAVYKVRGKMFGLCSSLDGAEGVNLKCDPELAQLLRNTYEGVRPGYHMNKKHWNTVDFDSDVPAAEFWKMVDHSYDRVVESLPKKIQASLKK